MSESWSGKNVLVTGGTGLVGSHLTERLLELGAKVFVLDIVLEANSYFASKKLADKAGLFMVDLRNFEGVKKVIAENQINYIFHLGAQALVPVALEQPMETLDANVMGTVHVLEAARQLGTVSGIVVASSDKAYGKDCINVKEDQKLAGDHPYDVSKTCADLISTTYFKTYNLPVAVARFGNIFGPGDLHFDRIVPGVMESLIKNQELQIRSNGKFRRDYLYVKDVAEGYIKMAQKAEEIKGEAFNFSTNWNFSVTELVEKIGQILGRQVHYKILDTQKNEIPEQSLNWDKAKKVLGWEPECSFEKGIEETVNWYNNYFSGKD
ncbi:MAG: GDP-mannose 4,6-dehydratase [Candidatus Doudnabacteria bacterium]|nr:GDP-mannose 4,6-dehydratase [Candidatus Doudnabacteria bacterium]